MLDFEKSLVFDVFHESYIGHYILCGHTETLSIVFYVAVYPRFSCNYRLSFMLLQSGCTGKLL